MSGADLEALLDSVGDEAAQLIVGGAPPAPAAPSAAPSSTNRPPVSISQQIAQKRALLASVRGECGILRREVADAKKKSHTLQQKKKQKRRRRNTIMEHLDRVAKDAFSTQVDLGADARQLKEQHLPKLQKELSSTALLTNLAIHEAKSQLLDPEQPEQEEEEEDEKDEGGGSGGGSSSSSRAGRRVNGAGEHRMFEVAGMCQEIIPFRVQYVVEEESLTIVKASALLGREAAVPVKKRDKKSNAQSLGSVKPEQSLDMEDEEEEEESRAILDIDLPGCVLQELEPALVRLRVSLSVHAFFTELRAYAKIHAERLRVGGRLAAAGDGAQDLEAQDAVRRRRAAAVGQAVAAAAREAASLELAKQDDSVNALCRAKRSKRTPPDQVQAHDDIMMSVMSACAEAAKKAAESVDVSQIQVGEEEDAGAGSSSSSSSSSSPSWVQYEPVEQPDMLVIRPPSSAPLKKQIIVRWQIVCAGNGGGGGRDGEVESSAVPVSGVLQRFSVTIRNSNGSMFLPRRESALSPAALTDNLTNMVQLWGPEKAMRVFLKSLGCKHATTV